jgi:tetratricopeptide (TPR) repeat protein
MYEGYGLDEISAFLTSIADAPGWAELTSRSLSRVHWMLFEFRPYTRQASLRNGEAAFRLAPDTRYHRALASAYMAADQFGDALEHHLFNEVHHPPLPGFKEPFASNYEDELADASTEQRKEMAAAFLRASSSIDGAETAEEVFLPVLRDTLWQLFRDRKLWAEIVDVSVCLSRHLPENNSVAFYHAYAANELGDRATAEMLYRSIIAQQPNNASALNNLAVVRENAGDLDEAQVLFARAAEIDPSAELYRKNLTQIEQKLAAVPRRSAPSSPATGAPDKRDRVHRAFAFPKVLSGRWTRSP